MKGLVFKKASLALSSLGVSALFAPFSVGGIRETLSSSGPGQYASTVQLAIQESDPQLMKRAQNLVVQEFEKNIRTVPELRTARTSIQRTGNEVVFLISTEKDLRTPMQQVLVHMIDGLNGRVGTRGRTHFYRNSFSRPPRAEFTVTVHDAEKRTVYINAEQAPLIDLLQVMRRQMPSFSYIIPQECALRRVFWTFGDPDPKKHPKNLELRAAMAKIAEMLRVRVDYSNGAFAFSGNCPLPSQTGYLDSQESNWGWPSEILPMRWVAIKEHPTGSFESNISRRPPLIQSPLPVQVSLPSNP